ncbi:beta-1,4-galactosyltransferase 2-like [Orbicella faveolata]|uniref:beta-1,4-galactosyltransferase 2-like n=1 Tax=Orbicella faveolata TaxID=48498 RepID=UPI0009E24F65|nr:beta-1,4-galactosyltransferase 2-like [Orbicella faveolata]
MKCLLNLFCFLFSLPYEQIFGGAGSFSREHFELINGFSNKFWGWGGEDDDLYNRISARGLELTRPSIRLGRYKMIKKFHKTSEEDSNRFDKLMDSAQRMDNDGLNSLKYAVENLTEHRLYTLVTVDVKEAMLQDQAESFLQNESTSGFFYDITTESNGDKTDKYDELFTIY